MSLNYLLFKSHTKYYGCMNKPVIFKRAPSRKIERDEHRDSILLLAFQKGDMPVAAYTLNMTLKDAFEYAVWLEAQDQEYLRLLEQRAQRMIDYNNLFLHSYGVQRH